MSELATCLRDQLTLVLAPLSIELRDDSAQHAGHAGAGDGAHFAIHIVSPRFVGVRTLERHRMVYAAAAPLMAGRIHALQITALTPEETGDRS
jgi:BolA family transcriptional regulator, general stress-responsive regulator